MVVFPPGRAVGWVFFAGDISCVEKDILCF